MKIRTDYLTNHSGSNTVEIIIDNPLLLEILQKYKDINLFRSGWDAPFGIGDYSFRHDIEHIELENHTRIPACCIYFWGDSHGFEIPDTLDKVLKMMLSMIEAVDYDEINDEPLFNQLKDELDLRKDEINSKFLKVSWYNEYDGDGGHFLQNFHYDPVNGETTTFIDMDEEAEEEDLE